MSEYRLFERILQSYGEVTPEYKFHPKRKWKFDYCYTREKLAIEIEGGIWIRGRHNSPKGYKKDMDKYNKCEILGYRLLRYSPDLLMRAETHDEIQMVLKQQREKQELIQFLLNNFIKNV